jgi:3-oxoacyl-(acyl-carrier-protein) synthase
VVSTVSVTTKNIVVVGDLFIEFVFADFSEEGSYEFANMKATSNTETEFASGREPNEMSRPTTSTRAGFMESQGCGAQILMSAATAIKMGATICEFCPFHVCVKT